MTGRFGTSALMHKSILDAANEQVQFGIQEVHFLNIFTGKTEPFRNSEQATSSMLVAAAGRIDELERQIAEIRSFLVMD